MSNWFTRNNPLPLMVWILLFLAFSAGYFAGGMINGFASRKDIQNTCNYFREVK